MILDTSDSSVTTVMEDRDFWRSLSALRKLSMRRSSSSNEMRIREGGGAAAGHAVASGSPSTTPRNVTPLTPLTPLRWKSASTREDAELVIEPREIKTREVDQQLSRLGTKLDAGDGDDHGVVEPHDVHQLVIQLGYEEVYRKPAAKLQPSEMQQPMTSGLGTSTTQPKPIDDISLNKEQLGTQQIGSSGDSSGGHERNPSSSPGDDAMTMTIEFLRARLLSERAASKAAKHEADQLSKKVLELEHELEEIVEQRQKAEKDAEKAISNLRNAGLCDKESPIWVSAEEEKELGQDAKVRESSNRCMTVADAVDFWSLPKKKLESLDCLTHNRESRAAIEHRLRKLWNQFSEEMTAHFAEERKEGDQGHVFAEFMSWMCQMPAVLQEILPTTVLRTVLVENTQRANNNKHPTGETAQEMNAKMDAELGKTVPQLGTLREEYEAQESVQKEWEQKYHVPQQKLEQRGRRMATHHPSLLDSDCNRERQEVDGPPMHHEGLMMRRSSAEDVHERSQKRELHRDINMTEILNSSCTNGVYVNMMTRDSSPPPPPPPPPPSPPQAQPQFSLGYGPGYDAPPLPPPNDFSSVAPEPSSIQDISSASRTSVSDVLQALQRLKLNIQAGSFPENLAPEVDIHGMKEHRFGEDPSVFPRSRYEVEAAPPVQYLQQGPAALLMQERLSQTWHHQSRNQRSNYLQQQQQEGANSRAPRVLESLDSPSSSSVGMSFNNNYPYSHTLVDGYHNNIILGGSSLYHHYSGNHVHSKQDMISLANNNDHDNYIDKLNVGKGIQFFFS